METSGDEHADIAQMLERKIAEAVPEAGGPVQIVGSTTTPSGDTDYEVSASLFIPLDPNDPALADVFVPLPVTGHVTLAPDGTTSVDLAPADEAIEREVRAWARTLIASGSVAGLEAAAPSHRPPQRPTHEIVVDPSGRRVLRRMGFVLF